MNSDDVRGEAVSNNLPVQLTTFIGREREIAEVGQLLSRSRIVTLTGSGGCGKTRLAIEAAARAAGEHQDWVWWVELAPVSTPALLPSAVAAGLFIREVPGEPLTETIAKKLQDRRALIVLDNCEHIVEACAGFVENILRSCPEVHVLATSRHTIDVEGEAAFRVPSMGLPDEEHPQGMRALMKTEAVRLFMERAVRSRPDFRVTAENAEEVAHICRRLDGIPLALELAAARVRMLSVRQIADELGDVYRLLAGGPRTVVSRHQSLRASIEWSYGLLGEDEKRLLRRLSVFNAGFTLDTSEAVCSENDIDGKEVLDLLSGLVDKSLVTVEDSGGVVRYGLLESIRQFARQMLAEASEEDVVRTRHLDYFTSLAEQAEPELDGPHMTRWVGILRREHDNFRSALDWSLSSGQGETGLRLAAALRGFWFANGSSSEAITWYDSLLSHDIVDRATRARGLLGAAVNSFQLLDLPGGYRHAEEAVSIAREIDERKSLARGLSLIGTARIWVNDFEGARPLCEEAIDIAREGGDPYTMSQAYLAVANGEWLSQGDVARARPAFEASLAAARESGSALRMGMALAPYGTMTSWADAERAEPLLLEAIGQLEQFGEPVFRSIAIAGLGWARLVRGDYERARAEAERVGELAVTSGSAGALGFARFVKGWLCRAQGNLDEAAAELEATAHLGQASLAGWASFWLIGLARVRLETGDPEGSASALEDAAGVLGQPRGLYRGLLADARARLARDRGDLEAAEALGHEALASLAEAGLKPWVLDTLDLLGWSAAEHESYREAARIFGAAQAVREALGYPRFPSQQAGYEADVNLARSGLGDAFGAAWAEGAAMSLEEAVGYARRGRGERGRPSTGWASLTPTELQVARFVADRLTNPQIAERMFVSRGTVKTHLSHIYTKLGISSRLELTDQVQKHPV